MSTYFFILKELSDEMSEVLATAASIYFGPHHESAPVQNATQVKAIVDNMKERFFDKLFRSSA
jgi:hypothetical protein